MKSVDLSGFWRAQHGVAVEGNPAFSHLTIENIDEKNWQKISVPAPWQTQFGFESSPGPLVYRHQFAAEITSSRRTWLEFSGVSAHATVWIDGSYAGDIDCPHATYAFEINSVDNVHNEHFVVLEVTAPSDPPWRIGSRHAGGIWKPVRLFETGMFRIARLKALCAEANYERAVINFSAEVDASSSGSARIRTTVRDGGSKKTVAEHNFEKSLASGSNRLQWSATIDTPNLWWPHALGEQPLHDVEIEIWHTDSTIDSPTEIGQPTIDEASDSRAFQIGLRSIHFEKSGRSRWAATANGEFFNMRMQDQPLIEMMPASTNVGEYVEHMVAMRDTHISVLHVANHVEADTFYDAADEFGVLIWQGLPEIRRRDKHRERSERLTRQTVEFLAPHPAVAAWTHNGGRFGNNVIEKSDATRSIIQKL